MDNKEYFVGNINIKFPEVYLRGFDSHGIKYRIGEIAKDIHGKVINSHIIKPLFIIGESSFKKYDDLQMEELHKIRMD